jgi:CDP-glucose 4,6-dehydratase
MAPMPGDSSTDRWEPTPSFWRNRAVAVTGATGFLGSHLTAALVHLGADVVVLSRDTIPPSPISEQWYNRVAIVHGACEDQAVMERLLGDYEVTTLFHLAAQSQVGAANRNPVATFEANITGTWAVLEAVRRSPKVAQMVTASSDKAYGTQPVLPYDEAMPLLAVNPYDVSKACADLLSHTYNATYDTPVCVTRCGNFFGPGDRNWARIIPSAMRSIVRGERPVIRSDGTLVRDYLYVVDGALAYMRLAEAMAENPDLAGEAFNFSTETPMTVLELVAQIQEVAGTNLEPEIQNIATHEIDEQFLSAAKAKSVLGWSPTLTMREALQETVDWYREYLTKESNG